MLITTMWCLIEHMRERIESKFRPTKGIFFVGLFLRDMIGGELDSWKSNEAIRYSIMIILLEATRPGPLKCFTLNLDGRMSYFRWSKWFRQRWPMICFIYWVGFGRSRNLAAILMTILESVDFHSLDQALAASRIVDRRWIRDWNEDFH